MHLPDICLEWEAAWGWEQEHDWVLQKTVPDVGDRATQVESEPCFVKRKGPSRGVLTGSPEAGEEPRQWPGYSWGRPRSVPPAQEKATAPPSRHLVSRHSPAGCPGRVGEGHSAWPSSSERGLGRHVASWD